MAERYGINVHGDSFGMDERGLPYLVPTVMEECRYNQDVQEMLDGEMAAQESDRVIQWQRSSRDRPPRRWARDASRLPLAVHDRNDARAGP